MGKKIALVLFGLLLIFSFAFILLTVIASSATWWVPDSFASIQEAINSPSVSPGDTIRVRPDIYNEHVVVNKTVSLIGENRLTTIIDGSGSGTVVDVTANNVYFSGFTVRNGDYGIRLSESTNSIISGNNVNNNEWEGIWVYNSSYCVISENNASNNKWGDGIWLRYSSHCTVSRNNAENNYAYGILFDYFSSNCTISENNATLNWIGISLEQGSHNCTVTRNNVDNNQYHGLQIYLSQNCTILRNNANSNYYYGIHASFSNNSAISKNRADNNGEGIYLEGSSRCTVGENVLHNNYYGIWLVYSDHCTAVGNTMNNNTIGLYLYNSNDLIVYHNNFVNNTNQAEIIESYNSAWDNGYPSGGNFWSNYTGVDYFSGPSQDESGSDGIGDTPHDIDASNTDNYPLMNLWTNIAITNILPCKTVVGIGYSLSINVTVENQGHDNETFDVTVYYNMTNVVATQEITLPSREFMTVTFVWNTAGLAKGNYTISAFAAPILGETDTTDNTLTDGWIIVAMAGDITGLTPNPYDFVPDGVVDGSDLAPVTRGFGSYPGIPVGPEYPIWHPNADINSDGVIDGDDMIVITRRFGEADP